MGFPIRKSSDQSSFAAPRSLSQRTTSFIASQRQGIHRMLLRHLIVLIIDARRSAAVAPDRSGTDGQSTKKDQFLARTCPAKSMRSGMNAPKCRDLAITTEHVPSSRCHGSRATTEAAREARLSDEPLMVWWSRSGSNRRPHACKARALPTELRPHQKASNPKGTKEKWWAWDDSNVRPHPYQGCALTT